jgi:GTPase
VILVHVDLFDKSVTSEDLLEFTQLAQAAGAAVVATMTAKRQVPDAKYFIGSGKVNEVREQVAALGATLAIFNHSLSPAQERNLENTLQCRVIDRTGLILDIFAQRARTFEGKLQVELAQLDHLSARLKRGWTHLERQRGGIGLRGPGETQLETDRRLVRQRVATLKKRLGKVRGQREQSQRARKRAAMPIITVVGYTNAGKSTLFNRLARAQVYVADKLFATLDPTLRRVHIPTIGNVVLADTVGFVRHLPHGLVEAFRATLEETQDADLLLHVVDASDAEHLEKIKAVEAVLQQIGAAHVPQLLVYNKIDLLDGVVPHVDYVTELGQETAVMAQQSPRRVWLSARSNDAAINGIGMLVEAIGELLTKHKTIDFFQNPQILF